MRARCAIPVLILLLAARGSASEVQKLDPLLAVASSPALALELGPMAAAAGVRLEGGVPVADLLVHLRGGDVSGLAALGIHPDAVIGEVASVRSVPLARLAELARRPEVAAIEAARRLRPLNDVSVPETRAPGAWSEFGVSGRGVVVGVIDTGIDWRHPDFKAADTTGAPTRIKALLDLSQLGSGPFSGTLYTEAQLNQGQVNAKDTVGHGTHVAGTAAGGGHADPRFRGVAYEADLVIVDADRDGDGSFSSTDIVNALSFIDQQAAALGKPYVINLSLGGHSGAHDGSELMELAVDALVGAGKPGKAVVIAAGNERADPSRHATAEVTGDYLDLTLGVPDYEPAAGAQNDLAVVNLWYEASSRFSVTLFTPSGKTVGPLAPGASNGSNGTSTVDGVVGIQNAVGGANPENGDLEASIVIIDSPTVPAEGLWTIRLTGDTGPFDAYIAATTIEAQFVDHTNEQGFIAEPGTARNAITVGAYVSKTRWEDKDGFTHVVPGAVIGAAASFSNSGPTRDGRTKPELCAPGAEIASSYSLDAPPESESSSFASPFPQQFPNFFILAGDRYAIQQGTSQACPHVTGAVALLFQLHPEWDILAARRVLTATARTDGFTDALPSVFGSGKLDVLAAARAAAGDSAPGDVDGNGATDVADAVLAIDFVLGSSTPNSDEARRADVNADGTLNVGDVALIVRAAVAGGAAPEELGGDTWLVPVSIAGEGAVAGAEIELAGEGVGGVRGARDGVLAAGAAAGPGRMRVVALALDGADLGGGSPVLTVAVRSAAPPTVRVERTRLLGHRAKAVRGTVALGPPLLAAPAALRLLPVAPNPGAAPLRFAFDLPGPAAVRVTAGIYDVAGRLVAQLGGGLREPGRHVLGWDAPLPAGAYWVRVAAGGQVAASRFTVVH